MVRATCIISFSTFMLEHDSVVLLPDVDIAEVSAALTYFGFR